MMTWPQNFSILSIKLTLFLLAYSWCQNRVSQCPMRSAVRDCLSRVNSGTKELHLSIVICEVPKYITDHTVEHSRRATWADTIFFDLNKIWRLDLQYCDCLYLSRASCVPDSVPSTLQTLSRLILATLQKSSQFDHEVKDRFFWP